MASAENDGASGASADERDVGWGGRDWVDDEDDQGSEAADLERLRADRPPHHEERDS